MPNQPGYFSTASLTNTAESANNTETVVATLTGVLPKWPGASIKLKGWARITTGAGTSAGLLQIRRGSLTGTLVSDANADNQQIAASKVCEISTSCEDTPGEGIFTYVLTYKGTGDTAVTNFNAARLEAFVN